MKAIYRIYKDLKEVPIGDNTGYRVMPLPGMKHQKIGISPSQKPTFFIEASSKDNRNPSDINLELISVFFNTYCELISGEVKTGGTFTIISLKTESIELEEYFVEVVYLVLKKLTSKPDILQLRIEIEKIINLFSKLTTPAIKTIQGLWAELLVIDQSNNVDYLVRSWHISGTSKFDFNDGVDKIEVKSTSKSRRIHSFSIEQLSPNLNSKLVIASVFAVRTGVGKSIFNLIDNISKRLHEKDLAFKINEIVAETLGRDLQNSFDIYFDYKLAQDTLQYYLSSNIPTISHNAIPREITQIHFECDISDVDTMEPTLRKSELHNCLNIR